MRLQLLSLIVLSVILSSGSQISLKYGMVSPTVRVALSGPVGLSNVLTIATYPLVFLGLLCFGLSAVVWLFVLSQVPLSTAYPFVALGIVITTTAGFFLFGEIMPAAKMLGICLIVGGVLAVATAKG